MSAITLFLLVQAAISLPPLGFLRQPDGRLCALYGVRGSFSIGEPLPEEILAALEWGAARLYKTPSVLRAANHIHEAPGPALFAPDASNGLVYVLLPEAGELAVYSPGNLRIQLVPELPRHIIAFAKAGARLRLVTRQATSFQIYAMDPVTWSMAPAGPPWNAAAATLDRQGELWTAEDRLVRSGGRLWLLEEAVLSLQPLEDGWIVAETSANRYLLRRDSAEEYVAPTNLP